MTVVHAFPSRHPRRRSDDNLPWTRGDQREFESVLATELAELRAAMTRNSTRLAVALGIAAFVTFVTPLAVQVTLFVLGRATPL